MKIVSACLAGIHCNWRGQAKTCREVVDLVIVGRAVPVCPEQLGGLTTPREPAEQRGDKVVTISGKDVTANFHRGAEEGLKIAQLFGSEEAILKARSPSCGVGMICDGSFTNKLTTGDGVFAKLLRAHGIKVISEEELCSSTTVEFPEALFFTQKKWYQNVLDPSWF
jgi:uncharacterized protein YbbK (DUF523 family)